MADHDTDGLKELLSGEGLTDDQIKDVDNVLKSFPCDVSFTIKYGVENEKFIVPNSIITLIVDLKRIARQPPTREWRSRNSRRGDWDRNRDRDNDKKDEDNEADQDDTNDTADDTPSPTPTPSTTTTTQTQENNNTNNNKSQKQRGRKGKQQKQQEKQQEKPEKTSQEEDGDDKDNNTNDDNKIEPADNATRDADDDGVFPSYAKKDSLKDEGEVRMVHAPYYPEDKEEKWWLILGETTHNKVLGAKSVLLKDYTQVKLQFLAPESVGTATYVLHLMCDSYIGCDQKKVIAIQVVEDKHEEVVDYGDLSDEDEEELDDTEEAEDEDEDGDATEKKDKLKHEWLWSRFNILIT